MDEPPKRLIDHVIFGQLEQPTTQTDRSIVFLEWIQKTEQEKTLQLEPTKNQF